jgi:hypothetical protein
MGREVGLDDISEDRKWVRWVMEESTVYLGKNRGWSVGVCIAFVGLVEDLVR